MCGIQIEACRGKDAQKAVRQFAEHGATKSQHLDDAAATTDVIFDAICTSNDLINDAALLQGFEANNQ
ncbi:hypothetical protein BH11PLA2_BH11PLA2_49540 [soil metagenome]